MRLWHQDLLSKLPRQQLGGQWRECIALLGKGWGRKHSTVNYVFNYTRYSLLLFTHYVYKESLRRGYNYDYSILGKALHRGNVRNETVRRNMLKQCRDNVLLRHNGRIKIYSEHDDNYLQECLNNLEGKGIVL